MRDYVTENGKWYCIDEEARYGPFTHITEAKQFMLELAHPNLNSTNEKELREERMRVANHRFYLLDKAFGQTWGYLICDSLGKPGEICIGKFRELFNAELFLKARRQLYIEKGE